MKKYLVIAMDIDLSAPGIVYGKLLREMQKTCEISLICPSVPACFISNVNRISCLPYKRLKFRLEKQLYCFLGTNITDIIWSKNICKHVKKVCREANYDGIISFTSCNCFAPLYLGKFLSKELMKKWIIYSVDAIPVPIQWSHNRRLHKNVTKQLHKIINSADAFYAANPIMLKYEKELFGDFKGNTGVVLTPHDNKSDYSITKHEGVHFLYTGNIYGPRKVDALLEAFAEFSKHYPESFLTFVGRFYSTIKDEYKYLIDEGKVFIHGFTENITPYYQTADVLIDIAADHPDDVYLSSKVVNYLPIRKPIVAISGDNSPVRLMLGGIPSILHCHHNPEEVYESLCNSIDFIDSDFSDRLDALRTFAVDTVALEFLNSINNI